MATSIASPTAGKGKITKRSSNSYSVEEWKRHRPLITQLYFEEGRTLKEVREHLEQEFNFAPTERMYKSRLHSWGLDKKKKEHEMLDLVRQGLQQQGDNRDKVFLVRGRAVTLADALHYFNRKGIKDPSILLGSNPLASDSPNDASSPEDFDVRTPLSSAVDSIEASSSINPNYDQGHSPSSLNTSQIPPLSIHSKSSNFPEVQLAQLQKLLGIQEWKPLPLFRNVSVEGFVTSRPGTALEVRYAEAVYAQTKNFYMEIFSARDFSVANTTWTATSDSALADQFYLAMYQGYGFLWNSQRDKAFEEFYKAFDMIETLLQEKQAGFLVYIFDLIIRHDGTGYEEPLLMLLQHVSDMAGARFGKNHSIYLIASWLRHPEGEMSKSWIAETTLRKLLHFFSDSIGYFHPETIALLQTFSTGLLNGKHYKEAAVRFHQLVDAFETTQNDRSYEVCYALRIMSEAYFHAEMYAESLQGLKIALDRSVGLPRAEEREIHARCFRAMAEIWSKLGKQEEASQCMQYVVDSCIESFGPEHPFVSRARAHQKSLREGGKQLETAIPPPVYRLGRGGPAAKWIWTSRSSPLRLQT